MLSFVQEAGAAPIHLLWLHVVHSRIPGLAQFPSLVRVSAASLKACPSAVMDLTATLTFQIRSVSVSIHLVGLEYYQIVARDRGLEARDPHHCPPQLNLTSELPSPQPITDVSTCCEPRPTGSIPGQLPRTLMDTLSR